MTLSIKKTIVAVITLCCVGIFGMTLLHNTLYATSDETEFEAPAAAPTTGLGTPQEYVAYSKGAPARIRIPAIGVDAHVQHVGVARSGNMAVPTNYTDAGWFREGTVPGEVGSAVLDGHVDNGLSIPAVFSRLGELQAGDDIYIDTLDGETLHFVAADARTYAVGEVPRELLFNRADVPRLNLITCDGTWLQDQKMYDERRVVYAVLAEN